MNFYNIVYDIVKKIPKGNVEVSEDGYIDMKKYCWDGIIEKQQ